MKRMTVMEYCVYYVTPNGERALHGCVQGKSEDECWLRACERFGKENIYGFTRIK